MDNQYYINTGNPSFAWIKRKGDPGRAHRSFKKNCTGTRHPVGQKGPFLSTNRVLLFFPSFFSLIRVRKQDLSRKFSAWEDFRL